MNFLQTFFLTVTLVYCVQSYRSESERSVPIYEVSADETQNSAESKGTASINRADRETKGAAQEEPDQEFSQLEEGFEKKSNKKDKNGHPSDSKSYKNNKKATNGEGGAETAYNKEYKNVGSKKNGKGYPNKKNNKHNAEQKVNYEELVADFAPDEELLPKSSNKRSSKVKDSATSKRTERVERSAKLEPEEMGEEQPQQFKDKKQEKNRKNGKNGKYSKKSKKGSKREKRSYFGFWA